ncbi:MAG: L-2-amino-thiazoline-4-carboxylic acid hydrolase [Candidatus Hermodarchaeota archaeon]
MKVETYKVYNPNAIVEINLSDEIKRAFTRTDQIINLIGEINPEITKKYLSAVKKRLTEIVKDFSMDTSAFDLNEMNNDLKNLKNHLDLQILILQFLSKQLDLPKDFQLGSEKIEVLSLNYIKSFRRLSYYYVKAFADVLGNEQGTQLWKKVVALQLKDARIKYEKARQEKIEQDKEDPTTLEMGEQQIKAWTKIGLGNFTVAIFDDNKILYRFDSCLTHEALKDLNDPDFAYLCSCYQSDVEGYNYKNPYLRRTQTLHHGDFCDELYWDPRVYNDPEQPSLEFTRKLGEKLKK